MASIESDESEDMHPVPNSAKHFDNYCDALDGCSYSETAGE